MDRYFLIYQFPLPVHTLNAEPVSAELVASTIEDSLSVSRRAQVAYDNYADTAMPGKRFGL